MTILRVVDFETTGFPPEAAVVEIGYTDVSLLQGRGIIHPTYSFLCDPAPFKVNLEAQAVHHIPRDELARAEVNHQQALKQLAKAPVDVWVAHVMGFERQFFDPEGSKWICTYKVARHLWPQAPKHTNQVLRYFLELEVDDKDAHPPHRAGPDTHVTAAILCKALESLSVMEMIDISQRADVPRLIETVSFGKYKGRTWSSVPKSYLSWLLNDYTGQKNPDVIHTIQYWLKH